MSECPILFSAPMIRALLAGNKTQTRRAIKVQPFDDPSGHGIQWDGGKCLLDAGYGATYLHTSRQSIERILPKFCPYGQPGDRLWVRETFQRFSDDGEVMYRADQKSFDAMNELKRDECLEARWRPSIHMPRWASRIDLEIESVHVERLQDISEGDALAEGMNRISHGREGYYYHAHRTEQDGHNWCCPIDAYRELWESINGPESWAANPWVWVVTFRRIKP